MVRHRFSSLSARAVLGGLSLIAAAMATGCEPDCKPDDKRAECQPPCDPEKEGSECNVCSAMPPKLTPEESKPVACRRRIAVDPSKTCVSYNNAAKVQAWKGQKLFEGGEAGTLGQYCQYDWVIAGAEPDATLLPPGLQNSEDCTYIAPQGGPPDKLDKWARANVLTSVNGYPATRPQAGAEDPSSGGMHTRVVVLDTSPDNDPSTLIEPGGSSHHGETLAYLIRDIACADPVKCSVQVKTQLVMPQLMKQGAVTPAPGGGNAGTLSDVSRGLWHEVHQFGIDVNNAAAALPISSDPAIAIPTRLVFNESFGWGNDPEHKQVCDDDPGNSEEWNVRALFDAFQAAACVGAMHVAAAGNHTGGTTPSDGLLCPARWHHKVAPSKQTCEDLLGVDVFAALQTDFKAVTNEKYGADQSLFDLAAKSVDALVSVGAVDYGGVPIVLTRPNACPEVVALGVGGVAWDTMSASPSAPPVLFGTSVSAAVVSGRLAAEWSQPGQPGQQGWAAFAPAMMKQLVGNEGKPGSFVTGGACTHLLAPTCDNAPWIAAPETSIPSQNPPFGKAGSVIEGYKPKQQDTIRNDLAPVCSGLIPQCVNETTSAAPSVVWGQPTDPLCLRCGVSRTGTPTLWVYPSGYYQPVSVNATTHQETCPYGTNVTCIRENATLVIENASGVPILTQGLSALDVTRNSTVTLIVNGGLDLTGARAWLSVYDMSGRSISQQIFVNP